MEREVAGEGRFFKIMLPGFHQKLNLPRAFCKKLEEEDEPGGAILESRKGTWEIGTRRNGEGAISFGDGWPEFARRHNLSVGDFVVFEHTGELHFNVVVFGPNGCEKEFPVGSKTGAIILAGKSNCPRGKIRDIYTLDIAGDQPANCCFNKINSKPLSFFNKKYCAIEQEFPVGFKREAIDQEGKLNSFPTQIRRQQNKNSGVSYHNEDPYFALTMTPYLAKNYAKPTIPVEFVKSNDLGKKSSASLRNPAGKVWAVSLYSRRRSQLSRRMSGGWHGFYVSNELKDGDVCVFVLNRSSRTSSTTVSFDVKIFRPSARN